MTTKVEKSIEVDVPVTTVYNQWTQFEEFPEFMGGVKEVRQLDDTRLHWVAEIAGVKREWDAKILEQIQDTKIAWAATSGATNAGAVYFAPLGAGRTSVRLSLEYEPEGIIENVGDKLGIVEKQARSDLERFKKFIEGRGSETGGWRGEVDGNMVGTPGVADAAALKGDKGKTGVSGKAVAAGAAAVAAAGVAAATMKGKNDDQKDETYVVEDVYVVDSQAPVYETGDVTATAVDIPVYPTDDAFADDLADESIRNRNRTS